MVRVCFVKMYNIYIIFSLSLQIEIELRWFMSDLTIFNQKKYIQFVTCWENIQIFMFDVKNVYDTTQIYNIKHSKEFIK